ncbi:dynamin family protein [Pseudomonas fluorescens]|uniref:dynamin family protein n=1 Tax=Pseudomonas fluorescens TaxID=294 RepID=UPI001241EB9B|nr:dynamin family protein [Pseudomonas fluorescens]VVQ35287.1 GTPase Era [Pseudomonas fluorescens]
MSLDFSFSLEELEAAQSATTNPHLSDPAKGLQLIASLVGRPRQAVGDVRQQQLCTALHRLIHEHFIDLASKGSYPGEALALRELQALEASLANLAQFPDLANKTVVGVGGGFSAGKSRLLNTLLGVDVLPESLEPTTAIPSFICQGEDDIVALNTFNQQIRLDRDGLQAITHAFSNHYRASLDEAFGFAHVLKLLMLHCRCFAWSNLAFLDTPGYSKADAQGSQPTDEAIALEQLREADQVVWLLSAKNGSIRQDDLAFLRSLEHPTPVFFVVTQADLVSASSIEAILQDTAKAIENSGIPCAGLMAWAAPLGVEQGKRIAGNDIRAWLDQLDQAPKFTQHRRTCERVLDGYIRHNQEKLSDSRSELSLFNTLLPLQNTLPQAEQATLQTLLRAQRAQQKVHAELVDAFTALKHEMLGIIAQIIGDLAIDALSSEELYGKGLALHEACEYDAAVACFQQAAEQGHCAAQFRLGTYYELGLGLCMDERMAAQCYRKAQQQGHAEAQFYLGVCYQNGVGVPVDQVSAAACYLQAAEQGHAEAQYHLGICLAKGDGVEQDEQQALAWLEKATEQDHPEARFYVINRAAQQGSPGARYALGILFEKGLGVRQNLDLAIASYRMAAEAGHADAQFELGRRYLQGDGVRKNSAHATAWLEKAAEQNHDGADALLEQQRVRSLPELGGFWSQHIRLRNHIR